MSGDIVTFQNCLKSVNYLFPIFFHYRNKMRVWVSPEFLPSNFFMVSEQV